MSKLFKGQVRIEDVKEAFEEITDRVNNIIDEYNTQVYVNNIDYTSGSKSLGATNYTLSVGGLKLMLRNLEGCVLGGKAFKVSDSRIKMTTGLLIHNGSVIKLPDSVIAVNESTKHIYFNPSTNTYSTTTGIRICDINMYRNTKLITGLNTVQCEELNKKFKIYSQTKDYTTGHKFVDWDGGFYENLDTSSNPKFLSAINAQIADGSQTRLFNTVVDSYSENDKDRAKQAFIPMTYLFIPKGVENPYTYFQKGIGVNVTKTNQKVLNVTIDK